MRKIVVFTDLDGTLLDHSSYGVRRALPALDLLVRRGHTVVPVSSKTAAEIRRWTRLLMLGGAFICENGCGIILPRGSLSSRPEGARDEDGEWRISLGKEIEEVRRGLEELAGRVGFAYRSFGQMSPEEVTGLTGLTDEERDLSLIREYDEPFTIVGGHDTEEIGTAAEGMGLHFTKGGRLYHLTGGCNKGGAVRILADLYRKELDDPFFVGIGDSFNDLPMLVNVDAAFLVQKADGSYDPLVPEEAARRVDGVGPQGWRVAVEEVMHLA